MGRIVKNKKTNFAVKPEIERDPDFELPILELSLSNERFIELSV